jgi:hypothetical protein
MDPPNHPASATQPPSVELVGDPELTRAAELQTVKASAVTEEGLRRRRKGEGLPELLGSTNSRRAFNDIAVEDSATIMGKHPEPVEHLKGPAGNGEEVDRNHAAEVIAKEGLPVVGRGAPHTRDPVVARRELIASLPLTATPSPSSNHSSNSIAEPSWMNRDGIVARRPMNCRKSVVMKAACEVAGVAAGRQPALPSSGCAGRPVLAAPRGRTCDPRARGRVPPG